MVLTEVSRSWAADRIGGIEDTIRRATRAGKPVELR
jgi:hypothetical protein